MKRLAGVGLLVALTPALSAWAGTRRASAVPALLPERALPAVSRSSGLILAGRVRCTATVRSRVRAGHAVSVRFVFRNVSRHRLKFFADAWLILKAADGTTYDTTVPGRGLPRPPPLPTTLRPGATRGPVRVEIAVRWRGPLRITPGCGRKTLRALRVGVSAPWPRPDESTAVSDVVAASGHLLDHCRPQTPGVPVYGPIYPPSGSAPPLSAECSLSLESEGRFWTAQLLVLTPPGLPGVVVQQPYELLAPPYYPFSAPPATPPPYEAIAWQFVVTRDGARSVAAAMADGSNTSATQTAPSWTWNGTAWHSMGAVPCGGRGFAWGTGPTIEFVSACPS